LKEIGGNVVLNNVPIMSPSPPRSVFVIRSNDPCYLEDLEILKDSQRTKKYVEQYGNIYSRLSQSNVVQPVPSSTAVSQSTVGRNVQSASGRNVDETEELIECTECRNQKDAATSISCSEAHVICRECFQKMVFLYT
jgi:NAD-dependent SIR2 family protein deacetylase